MRKYQRHNVIKTESQNQNKPPLMDTCMIGTLIETHYKFNTFNKLNN